MTYYGVYVGVVVGNQDPTNAGRVQVRLPMTGQTAWALVASPFGATPSGRAQPGSRVVVAFENGDPSHPVVLGRLGT